MLVLLHFFNLGYSPVTLAFLFLLYEFFGIVTNLLGGWIASRMGLRVTLVAGLRCRSRRSGCWHCSTRIGRKFAVGGMGDDFAGALRHREGPHQDEFQERDQGARAADAKGHALQVGGHAHRL
jgi:hypothetical protein